MPIQPRSGQRAAPRGRPRDPSAHRAILAATAEVLRDRGYPATTIEAISARAGVGKQTIYRWWPTKAALVLELYDQESADTLGHVATGSLAGDLSEQVRRLWRLWRTSAGGQAFLNVVADAEPGERDRLRDEYLAPRRAYPRRLLSEAIRRGELEQATDVETLLDLLFGFSWYRLLTNRLDSDDDIDAMVRLLLHGAMTRG